MHAYLSYRISFISLDSAMREALIFSITDVVEKGSQLPIHTIEAYNSFALTSKAPAAK